MLINTKCKIEAMASSDANRYGLNAVALDLSDPTKPLAVATNGSALACVPVELEPGDTEGMVPCAALSEARKAARKAETVSVKANGHVEYQGKAGTVSMPRPYDGPTEGIKVFPNWREVVKDPKGSVVRIGIDAAMLLVLAEAIGAGSKGGTHVAITIQLDSNGRPTLDAMKVEPTTGTTAAWGVIMPVMLD
jgi:hypothetical protein